MKLNVEKILNELKRIDRSQAWLAKQIPTSQQLVNYWLNSGSLRGAVPISKVLQVDPKDLVE